MSKFTDAELRSLKKLASINDNKVVDAIGEGRCAPTGQHWLRSAERLANEYAKQKDDEKYKTYAEREKKSIIESIERCQKDVEEFDKYWNKHRQEILYECSEARKTLNHIK